MLELGCFGNCDANIPTRVIPVVLGEFSFEFNFNNVLHKTKIMIEELSEIKLPNIFTPSIRHFVTIRNPEGVIIEKVTFKIHTQCL